VKKQYLIAVSILALIIVWMIIPRGERESVDTYANTSEPASVNVIAEGEQMADVTGFTVRAKRITPALYTQTVDVRGRTRADRLVSIRAETAGRVVGTPVPRGGRVEAGDLLCELAVDNREVDLQEAVSRQEQARLEYEGAVDLQNRNLASRGDLAQVKASFDAATAAVSRAELALERTRIRAPFSGIMENRMVEVGDYMNVGGECATLLDDDPMILIAEVPEEDVGNISLGSAVQANLTTGTVVDASLTYVARASDPVTRSYRIEAEITSDTEVRQGISADISINANQIEAYLVPPSSLSLDDEGLVGVKTLSEEDVVSFNRVTIVGESTDMTNPGFWVTGLNNEAVVITLGQELVVAGQQVNVNFDWATL
tara:strand:- start:3388 stop:4503 length:1116 start_codon:yes stop_codon:yes gene_type:complete